MTFSKMIQRVYELADGAAQITATDYDQEAVDSFHDFVTNCPWLWLEDDEGEE
jgi:hypothetical protein